MANKKIKEFLHDLFIGVWLLSLGAYTVAAIGGANPPPLAWGGLIGSFVLARGLWAYDKYVRKENP